MITPNTALTRAAMSAVRKLRRSAASVRGPVTTSRKPPTPRCADFSTSAPSGTRTIRLRYVKVKPSANPKPGMALGLFNARPRAPAMAFSLRVAPRLVGRLRLIDLIEDAAFVEMLGLYLGPA